jgi:hypothetical protein
MSPIVRGTLVLLAGILFSFGSAAAQSGRDAAGGQETTITGQVVDLTCFSHGHSGDSHKTCAEACGKAGVQLGVLGTDGTLYVPISDKPADPTNSRLQRFAEQKVRVTGVHRVVNGLHTIELKSVGAATGAP